jgi:O-methyltransferase
MTTLAPLARQYLDLLKASLLNELYVENEAKLVYTYHCMANRLPLDFRQFRDFTLVQADLLKTVSSAKAEGATLALSMTLPNGQRKPADALRNVTELSHTMVGRARLDNLEQCARMVIDEKVPGDFIETGIWRGGSCIFMRGFLLACDDRERVVWAADSFEGVPPPTLPQDAGFDISREVLPVLAVSVDEVKQLFQRYGLLDARVRFLKTATSMNPRWMRWCRSTTRCSPAAS